MNANAQRWGSRQARLAHIERLKQQARKDRKSFASKALEWLLVYLGKSIRWITKYGPLVLVFLVVRLGKLLRWIANGLYQCLRRIVLTVLQYWRVVLAAVVLTIAWQIGMWRNNQPISGAEKLLFLLGAVTVVATLWSFIKPTPGTKESKVWLQSFLSLLFGGASLYLGFFGL